MLMLQSRLSWMILAVAGGLTTLTPSEVLADYIQPVSATSTGTFGGTASSLIDTVIPPRGTAASAPTNVVWNSLSTFFTIDFGSVQTVANLTVSVDNNDDYLVQSSTDGINFKNLFTFLATDGPVTPSQGGSDILSTDSRYPSAVTYPGDATTPEYVGRGFAPTDVRYLRVSATAGDSVYAVGEVDAFTASVPEPASVVLCGLAGLVGLAASKIRRRHFA